MSIVSIIKSIAKYVGMALLVLILLIIWKLYSGRVQYNEWAEKQAQLQSEFDASRETILKEARQYMADKAYWLVLDFTKKFSDLQDSELVSLRKQAEEQMLYEKVRNLPARKVGSNLEGYTKLLEFDPDNKVYQKKKAYYQTKYEAIEKKVAPFGPRPKLSYSGYYREVERYLELNLKDPDSLKMGSCTETSYNDLGWLVGCEYRARNSFGGYVHEAKWFTIRSGQVIKVEEADAYNF